MARKSSDTQKEKAPSMNINFSNKSTSFVKTKNVKKEELFEMIQKRAYELYLGRKGSYGAPEKDWYEAEKEIRSKYNLV